MTPAMTPALTAELRHAATVLAAAIAGSRRADPVAVAAAHNTFIQRRHAARGPVRDAIDHYLDADTWHHGPYVLRDAALELAGALGVSPPDDPARLSWGVQLSLFDPPDDLQS